jgi:hypothetical protein
MASQNKVQVIAKDDTGKDIPFGTKTLTAEFKGKKGKVYGIAIQEPKGTRVEVGNYTVQEGSAVPPTPTNKPLVVNAGADITITEGQPVILDGKASDPDNKIIRCDWTQLDAAVMPVELKIDPADFTNVSFTAPMIETDREVLRFQMEVENDIHEIIMDTVNVTIVTDAVPEPPKPIEGLPDLSKGIILFDSNTIWGNGHARTMTGHHEYDPDDPNTECGAGGHGTPRVWAIDGKGHSKLSGGMSRVYNHKKHNGLTCLLQTFIFAESLENFSLEVDSRHNEGGAIENRTGGFQNALHRKTVGGKYESYHKSYHDLGDKTYPGGREIKTGDTVSFALLTFHDGINYEETMFIDWDHNGKYEKVFNAKYIEKENPAGALKEPLYWRWRVNGTAPKDIETWNVKFIQL